MTPLMPMSLIVVPYEPSSDTGHLELLSDESSPTRHELQIIDRKLFEADTIKKKENPIAIAREAEDMIPHMEHIGDIYSPLRGIEEPPSSPPLRKPSIRDIKVEVPLTPPRSDQPPPWKRKYASFSEALLEVIPELPSPLPKPEEVSSEDMDRFFAESIGPIAMEAERNIEQEQLQESDTTRRVKVPIMDFSRPVAPWKADSTAKVQCHKDILTDIKKNHFQKHQWPSTGANELTLKWMPFPAALGRVEIYETIPDDESLQDFLAQPECVDPSTLIWKRDGLCVLDELEDSDGEELGYATLPDDDDMAFLLRKRKLELEQMDEAESEEMEDHPVYKPINHDAFRKVPRLSPRAKNKVSPKPEQTMHIRNNQKGVLSDSFAAINSLENFMSLRNRGSKDSKLTAQQHFQSKSPAKFQSIIVEHERHAACADARQTLVPPRSFSTPQLNIPEHPTSFVVSTSLLSRRSLVGLIKRLYPTAEIIERDFSLHSTPHQKHPARHDNAFLSYGSISDEADILLSPSTGLILTTLQKINQRSLPGQVAKSTIRERIRRTAPRYEKLLVLVSHDTSELFTSNIGSGAASHSLNECDGEALVEFTAFCSAMEDECRLLMITGTEDDLARWIVSIMINWGLNDASVRLIQEETLWEVFLRRAGMNAFAAQAILGELKLPDVNNTGTQESPNQGSGPEDGCGLSAFIKMSLTERIARFSLLLGGSKMLIRVSTILDAHW